MGVKLTLCSCVSVSVCLGPVVPGPDVPRHVPGTPVQWPYCVHHL